MLHKISTLPDENSNYHKSMSNNDALQLSLSEH